jgi:SAM-dependent methyltransferase
MKKYATFIPVLSMLAALTLFANTGTQSTSSPTRQPDVIFVPTPQSAVDKMLELAEIKETDLVYDLGCGDGRIVVTAAKVYGVRAVGVDIDPQRVKESKANVIDNGVEDKVTIMEGDIFEVDFSEADVVTLYLLPSLNVKLMPLLAQLKPGTRIISYEFNMAGAKPHTIYTSSQDDGEPFYTIYKWVVPWEEEEFTLSEHFYDGY